MNLNENKKTEIIEKWLKRVREQFPEIGDNSRVVLKDDLPEFLDKLFKAFESKTKKDIQEVCRSSKEHGVQRSRLEEYSIEQIIKEYSILRFTILEVLSDMDDQERNIVHLCIDDSQGLAVGQFAKEREGIANKLTDDLLRTNQDLERFSAIAAHDLRLPLATIIGYLDILQDEFGASPNGASESLKQSLEFMQSSAARMLLLIERLLSYARLGHADTHSQDVELEQIVREVMISLNDPTSDIKTVVECERLPKIKADACLVQQLFQNLISNSIKFKSDKLPIIKIAQDAENEEFWTISVKDNGIGFDSDREGQIFEPFKRLNHTRDYQGAGLGLATVKRIVELLGGRIWAESRVGQGSKFIFTISKDFKTDQ